MGMNNMVKQKIDVAKVLLFIFCHIRIQHFTPSETKKMQVAKNALCFKDSFFLQFTETYINF